MGERGTGPTPRRFDRHRLTPDQHQPQGGRACGGASLTFVDPLLPISGRGIDDGRRKLQKAVEQEGGLEQARTTDDDRGASQEGGHDLVDRDVEAGGGEEEDAVGGVEAPVARRSQQVGRGLRMLHGDPLGTARGARGVDEVGEALGGSFRRGQGQPRDGNVRWIVEGQDRRRLRQHGAEACQGEHHRGAGVDEHESQPLRRITGVEREVDAAGGEDSEEGEDGSGERSRQTPTGTSGPTPRSRRRRASAPARAPISR